MPDLPTIAPRVAAGTRQTQPTGWNPYTTGSGVGVLARRGVAQTGFVSTRDALMRLGQGNPLRLLGYTADFHPAVGLATWNALRLSCAPGDLTFTAVNPSGTDETDDAGTEALARLWESQPAEIGGLHGLRTTLTLQLLFTGLGAIEAVPAAQGAGVARVWPADSLTIYFERDRQTTEVVPFQRQMYPIGDPRRNNLLAGQYQKLNTNTFFWRAMDQWPDDPYGRAPYAPVVNEVLCDLAMIEDLRTAIYNAGHPQKSFGFNFVESQKLAVESFGMDSITAATFAQRQFTDLQEAVMNLPPGGTFFHDSNGGLEVIEGAKGFTALAEILSFLRQRVTQALKSLPTLMGTNDSATASYTTVEWQIYAAGLETVRSLVVDLLSMAANLHLQLLGMPLVAKADYQPIRTTDAMIEANTDSVRIDNAVRLVGLGWLSNEDACQSVTGTAPFAEMGDNADIAAAGADAAQGGGSTADLPAAGVTTEERQANRDASQSTKQQAAKQAAFATFKREWQAQVRERRLRFEKSGEIDDSHEHTITTKTREHGDKTARPAAI